MTAHDYTDEAMLTAYVLGELDADDARAIEARLEANADLRREVDAIRATTDLLAAEMAAETSGEHAIGLTDAQRERVLRGDDATNPPVILTFPRLVLGGVGLAAAACLAIVVVLQGRADLGGPTGPNTVAITNGDALRGQAAPTEAASESRRAGSRSDRLHDAIAGGDLVMGGHDAAAVAGSGGADRGRRERTLGKSAEGETVADRFAEVAMSQAPASRAPSAPTAAAMTLPSRAGNGAGRSGAQAGAAGVPFIPTTDPRAKQFTADDDALAVRQEQTFNREAYGHLVDNPFRRPSETPLSTFSIDVDTASYAIARRFLNEGRLPPKDAVRLEEMINFFDYPYEPPTGPEPFSVAVDVAGCPWATQHRLVRIGLKGREVPRDMRPATNLVFLIDVSGSMNRANKLPLLQQAMVTLVDNLTADDRVAIVVYAGAAGLVLPSTYCDEREMIAAAIANLRAGGSTNGGAGIELAYRTAQEHFIEGGVNRVILCTDGDFNVGTSSEGALIELIEKKRESGVFLSVLGFGTGNFQDARMEQISNHGNGNYAYIDTLDEAKKVLVEDMSGTLVTIAKDVKIQVEFNPATVGAYRLIGYANRMLAAEDFNDDRKDAGEIGAGHTVTALYEIVPPGVALPVPGVDDLKYQEPAAASTAGAGGELLTVKLRFKQPDGDVSSLIERPVTDDETTLAAASDDFRFAAAVAGFGMTLRESPYRGSATYASVLDLATGALGADPKGRRAEFVRLVERAGAIAGK